MMQTALAVRGGRRLVGYGVQAIKRRRSNRRRQNRYVVGARMMGIPFAANTAPMYRMRARRQNRRGIGRRRNNGRAFQNNRVTIANVRQNVQSEGDQSALVFMNTERMVVDIPISAESNGMYEQYTFDPLSPALPLLQQKSSQYAAMTIQSLSFQYKPRTGTSVNGNFYCAFTKELADTGTYQVPNQLTSLHHIYGQCSESNLRPLIVTPGECNENGKLLVNNGDIAVEPTKYFPGQLIFGTSEVTADVESVGHLECTYIIKLERSRLPLETQNTIGAQAGGAAAVTVKGVAWVTRRPELDTVNKYCYRNYSLTSSNLVICSPTASAVLLYDQDVAPITPTDIIDGDTESMREYLLPACTDFYITKADGVRWLMRRLDGFVIKPH